MPSFEGGTRNRLGPGKRQNRPDSILAARGVDIGRHSAILLRTILSKKILQASTRDLSDTASLASSFKKPRGLILCLSSFPVVYRLAFPALPILFSLLAVVGRAQDPPSLPVAVASFGAATSDGNIYLYGGHQGTTHEHSEQNITGDFYCWKSTGEQWEKLPSGPALQGVSLVSHGDSIIRVGGLYSVSAQGEPEEIFSSDQVARYDTATGHWHSLPDLPSVRSSHDCAVIGDTLYVVGGWGMKRTGEIIWHNAGVALDLSVSGSEWVPFDQPFERRALAVGALNGELYVIGGMNSEDEVCSEVAIYDPKRKQWSDGPSLPGHALNGFGAACVVDTAGLFISCFDGHIFRYDETEQHWELHWTLGLPRHMHRMVVQNATDANQNRVGKHILVLGGETTSGHASLIETVPQQPVHDQVIVNTWRLKNPSGVVHAQGTCLLQGDILSIGGSTRQKQFHSNPSHSSAESFRIDLASMKVEEIADSPSPNLRTELIAIEEETEPIVLAFGGLIDQQPETSRIGTMVYFPEQDTWSRVGFAIPEKRWLFRLIRDGAGIWMFGGFSTGEQTGKFEYPKRILCFDPSTPNLGFCPTAFELRQSRFGFACAKLGSKVYFVGGYESTEKLANECAAFDLETKKWSTIAELPYAHVRGEMIAHRGKLYLAGGQSRRNSQTLGKDNALLEFDPASNEWTQLIDELPFNTSNIKLFSLEHRLLCFGIQNESEKNLEVSLIKIPTELQIELPDLDMVKKSQSPAALAITLPAWKLSRGTQILTPRGRVPQ